MQTFVSDRLGRVVIIGLKPGDLILESITSEIQRLGIKNAIVTSGIAATSHMRWHHIHDTSPWPRDDIYETDGAMEIGGIGGLVIDGTPHLHCTFADHNRAWAGHLEMGCVVQYVGEISIIEVLDLDLARVADDHGVKTIQAKPAE